MKLVNSLFVAFHTISARIPVRFDITISLT